MNLNATADLSPFSRLNFHANITPGLRLGLHASAAFAAIKRTEFQNQFLSHGRFKSFVLIYLSAKRKIMNTFRKALQQESPLQILGTFNAYVAMMAKEAGFQALYLSGASLSNFSYGLPDLGIFSLDNLLEDLGRISDAVDLPLLVDIDTGWGGGLILERAMRLLWRQGAAAVQIEDQEEAKRCGHRPGKKIVTSQEMVERIEAAVAGRPSEEMLIVARSDAYASEGLQKTIERGKAYIAAGADLFFPEALTTLEEFQLCCKEISIPILANMTEFGKSPLLTTAQLKDAGVSAVLYPLTIARAMNSTAWDTMNFLRQEGTQGPLLERMQTRDELYHFLNYHFKEGDKEK